MICKNNLPHQFIIAHELENSQCEVCELCGYKTRWQKDAKGRVDNTQYLKAHARDFCQPKGPTRSLYYKIYTPKSYSVVRVCLNEVCNTNGVCTHKQGIRTELRIDTRVKPKPGMTYYEP